MMRCANFWTAACTPSPSKRPDGTAFLSTLRGTSPMKKHLLAAVAAASLCVALPALAQNVAVVNGKPVPKARVDALASQLTKAGRPVGPEMNDQLKEEVIAREVFMQEAQKRALAATDNKKNQRELARRAVLTRELFADYKKKNPVSDADTQAKYNKSAASKGGKKSRARHIL